MCIRAVMEYALNGTTQEVCGSAKMFLTMAKPQIDSNNKKWMNATKKSKAQSEKQITESQNTTKTVAKRKLGATKVQANRNQSTSKVGANVNVNVNDNDNENVTVNENEHVKENGTLCSELYNSNACVTQNDCDTDACPTRTYGEYKNVILSDTQYKRLKAELGKTRLEASIDHLTRYIKRKPHFNSGSHFEDLRGWVQDALKERGYTSRASPAKNSIFDDLDLEDFFEMPDG
ncbi:MAG: hypothetical protein J6K12_04745 [Clostridia bacterium]|nr:hypothetical protein [Clostridia bacterium]